MAQIITNFWLSRAVFAAARLKLADALSRGPLTAAEAACCIGVHPGALYRLMRMLAAGEVLTEDAQGRFGLTEFGRALRSDAPGSLYAFAMVELGDAHYEAWGDLVHSVKTGKPAFDSKFGMPLWNYYACDERAGRNFDRSMTELSNVVVPSVVARYDASRFRTAVDVAGGQGRLLYSLLEANPQLQGILFDLPAVVKGAKACPAAAWLNERCQRVCGDMFQAVPEGGDLYLLKWILHDWDDERAVRILQNVRRAIAPGGRLAAVELMIPEDSSPALAKFSDLDRLVTTGGRERTESEFAELFRRGGFRLTRTVPVEASMFVIEGEPV